MAGKTFVRVSVITHDDTEICGDVHDANKGVIATLNISDYPFDASIHVTRQSLQNIIDACLKLQAQLAERTAEQCRT